MRAISLRKTSTAAQFIFIGMGIRAETENGMKPALFAALAVAALFLSACGDSVGLESAPKVASVSDLDSCAAENAGEAVFVEDERMLYTCGENGWKAAIEPVKPEESKDSGKTDTVREVVSFPDLDSCTAENAGEETLVKDEGMRYTCGEEGWIAANESAEYGDCGAAVVSNDSVSKCGEDGTFRDSRDGRVYKCVKIGDQTWMAENLDFGEQIAHQITQSHASAAHAQKFCYDDDSTKCAEFGGLYQWHAAMGLCAGYGAKDASSQIGAPHRGICPAGWHVPSQDEWEQLVEFVRSPEVNDAGDMLKSKEGWDGFSREAPMGTYGDFVCRDDGWMLLANAASKAKYDSIKAGYCADSAWVRDIVPPSAPLLPGDFVSSRARGQNGQDKYGWRALPSGYFLHAHRYEQGAPHQGIINSWWDKFVADEAFFWSTGQKESDANGYGVSAYSKYAGRMVLFCGATKDSTTAFGYTCNGDATPPKELTAAPLLTDPLDYEVSIASSMMSGSKHSARSIRCVQD